MKEDVVLDWSHLPKIGMDKDCFDSWLDSTLMNVIVEQIITLPFG